MMKLLGQSIRRGSGLATVGLLLGPLTAVSLAQPPGPPGGPPGPPPGGPMGGMGMLLRTQEVRDELALTQDQMMDLRDMAQDFRGRMEERMRGRGGRRGEGRRPEGRRPEGRRPEGGRRGPEAEGRRGPPPGERRGPRGGGEGFREEMRARMQEVREEIESRLGEILDDEQMGRLKELAVQHQLQHGGPRALLHGEVGDALQLSDDQRDELRDRAEELRGEARDKIREIQRANHAELLNVLTSEQRATLDGMTGEPFDFPEMERPGGRRGGPGADRRPPRGGPKGRRSGGSGRKPPRGDGSHGEESE